MRPFALLSLIGITLIAPGVLHAQTLGELPPPRQLPSTIKPAADWPAPATTTSAPTWQAPALHGPAASATAPPANVQAAQSEPVRTRPKRDAWRPTAQGPLVVPPRPAAPLRPTGPPAQVAEHVPAAIESSSPPERFFPAPTTVHPVPRGVPGVTPVQFEYLAPDLPPGPPVEPPFSRQVAQQVSPPPPPIPAPLPMPGSNPPSNLPQAPAPPPEPPVTTLRNSPPPNSIPDAPITPAPQTGSQMNFSYAEPPWLSTPGYGTDISSGAHCDGNGCDGIGCDGVGCDGMALGKSFDGGLFLPFASFQFKPGDSRVLTEGRLFLPLFQTRRSLFFADLRGQVDDRRAAEGNWGIGYRTFTPDNWIFGFYGYYDLLHSRNNNNFSQGTVGIELMSLNWDFRVNGYFPETGTKTAGAVADVSGGNIVVNNFGEKAYGGMDFETGYRIGHWGQNDRFEVRWFAGGYYFDAGGAGYKAMIGPRTRLEMRIYDLNLLGFQSRFEGGAEFTYDRVRDEQVFGYMRLRVPLSGPRRSSLSPLRRRMVDLPVRDMDVVTNRQIDSTDRAIDAHGNRIDNYVRVTAQDNFLESIYSAGRNSLVALDGQQGTFFLNRYQSINLQEGQTLAGGGSQVMLYGEHSGQAAPLTLAGSRPEILHASNTSPFYPALSVYTTSTDAEIAPEYGTVSHHELSMPLWAGNTPTVQLANNSTIQSIKIIGGNAGVRGDYVNNVRVSDLQIQHVSGTGISLDNVQHATLDGVTVRDSEGVGIDVNSSRHIAVKNALVERATGSGIRFNSVRDSSIQSATVREIATGFYPGPIFYANDAMTADGMESISLPYFDFAYWPKNAIETTNTENLRLTGNQLSGAMELRELRGITNIVDNDIEFDTETGLSASTISTGTINIHGNTIKATNVNQLGHAMNIFLGNTSGSTVNVQDNQLLNLSQHGITVQDHSTAQGNSSATSIRIIDNSIKYQQIGTNDPPIYWYLQNDSVTEPTVSPIQISSRGLTDVVVNGNQVAVKALSGQYADFVSRIQAFDHGQITLGLQNNTGPIDHFELQQLGNGRIDLTSESGNAFDVVRDSP